MIVVVVVVVVEADVFASGFMLLECHNARVNIVEDYLVR